MKPTPSWANAWRPVIGFPIALIVVSLLIVITRRTFPLPVEHSTAHLVYHGDSFDVDTDVTNHTNAPMTRTLSVLGGAYFSNNAVPDSRFLTTAKSW